MGLNPHVSKWILILMISFGLFGCGSDFGFGEKKPESKPQPNSPLNPTNGQGQGEAGSPESQEGMTVVRVPVETFLEGGGNIPQRLNAYALTVKFRSNHPEAGFECRSTLHRPFRACDSEFVFGKDQTSGNEEGLLVHGKSYSLFVRAKLTDGRFDATPLKISFLVDHLVGKEENERDDIPANPVLSASDLPSPINPDQRERSENRLLLVGSFYGLSVPYGFRVTSYSTTKTYNQRLHILAMTGSHGGAAYSNLACNLPFEKLTRGPLGVQYCESTPTTTELREFYANPMPKNHVEIVADETIPMEKLMVMSFDDEGDQTEGIMGIDALCQRGQGHGGSEVPLLQGFFDQEAKVEFFKWCQVKDKNGKVWWLGTFLSHLQQVASAPRIRAIYTASQDLGLLTGQQFALRASGFFKRLLVPVAQAVTN
jgi:hypothetical protein